MKLIKVAAAVLNQTPLDWDGNFINIKNAILQARQENVTILCLPELTISGYGCEDAFHAPSTVKSAWSMLQNVLPLTSNMIVAIGLPVFHSNGLFNTICMVVDGRIQGFIAKRFLAGDGIHYEPRWFKPWPAGIRGDLELDGVVYPMGDIYFNCGGVRIGFEICEDAWVANRPGTSLALKGIDIILNPSASHFAFGKIDVRKRFVLEGSRAFGVSYVYANLLGNESGRAIYDGGALIASGGKLIAQGTRFSFKNNILTSAVVDIETTRMNQARTASFKPDLHDDDDLCIRTSFNYPSVEPDNKPLIEEPWERSEHKKEEEFTRAIALGLFDYMRKSKSCGFVVSLSGGADSAAVSCLVKFMVDFGVKELGAPTFIQKLDYMHKLNGLSDAQSIIQRLLSCVYQATTNSSVTTQTAAQKLAADIGAEFYCFDVEPIVQMYRNIVEKAIERELSWGTDDITLQNIQARVRAPGVWMLANINNALLLATSNRSEAAVGYATMDGDTCGGLSPIAGIDKAFLRKWLHWIEKIGPHDLLPMGILSVINIQVPTAELRPGEQHQTDENDLMPYDILDSIEKLAIRDKHDPTEVYRVISAQFTQYAPDQIKDWVEKFFRLWCRNQWKRERYAPSFHVDDENLDPKTWCRFPILSGGYEKELKALYSIK